MRKRVARRAIAIDNYAIEVLFAEAFQGGRHIGGQLHAEAYHAEDAAKFTKGFRLWGIYERSDVHNNFDYKPG